MPLLDLTYSEGALDTEARDALADDLTAAILRAERAPDGEFFRSVTWASVHELPMFSGGRPTQEPVFRVDATVPEGALSERRKAEFIEAATKAVFERAGLDESAGLRVFVLVHEVPEGNWGAAGNVVRFSQLRELAAQEREKAGAPS
jgi:phenylpyruvate tautomerase PptA (4-oxalocrotonate tautomerase family)